MTTIVDPNIYTDFSAIKSLKYQAAAKDDGALKEVAKQFESIFLQMVLKSMRQANEAFASDLFSSNTMDMYQEMHDQQLSLSLSDKGIGLQEMIIKQLSPHYQSIQDKSYSSDKLLTLHEKQNVSFGSDNLENSIFTKAIKDYQKVDKLINAVNK